VPTHTAPADLYRHSLRLLLEKNIPAWAGLWAEDGVMEFPFAPQGRPGRLAGTVRDGRFTSYRDYWNPLALLEPGAEFAGNAR
jgi:uncharacterized protein